MNFAKVMQQLAAAQGIAAAAVSLLPAVSAAVQSAETALGPGNGAAKLAVVQNTIQAAYATIQGAEVAWTDLQPVVANMVSSAVTFFNTVKAFAHAGQPAAPKPAT